MADVSSGIEDMTSKEWFGEHTDTYNCFLSSSLITDLKKDVVSQVVNY